MNDNEKTSRILGYLFTALTGLAALTAVLAVLFDFEVQSHYFRSGAVLPRIAAKFVLATVAVGASRSLLTKKAQIGEHPFRTSKFLSPAFYGFLIGALLLLLQEISATTILMALCLVLSAAYVFFAESPSVQKDAGTTVFYGFSTILSPICFCALFYFDASIEINAPMKVASTLALLCSMLCFTGELRFLLGRPLKKLFLVLAHTAAAISIPVSLVVFTAFWMGVAHTVANATTLSFSTLLQSQRLEYLSASVVLLCTGLRAYAKAECLLSQPQNSAGTEDSSPVACAAPSEEPAETASAQEQTEKQPLPWEVDIDTLNRKE